MLYLGFRGISFSRVVALFIPESNSFPYSWSYITLAFCFFVLFLRGWCLLVLRFSFFALGFRIGVSLGVLFLGGRSLSFPVAV